MKCTGDSLSKYLLRVVGSVSDQVNRLRITARHTAGCVDEFEQNGVHC